MDAQENPPLHDAAEIARDCMYVMSMPRLAFTDNMYSATNAVYSLGIFGERHGGAFWEQGVENLLETAQEKNYKYGLTIDYDTFYTPYHIADLYRLMEAHPEIDILLPLQTRRGHNHPLAATFKDPQGDLVKVYTQDAFVDGVAPIDTGHFGLTMIRMESLKRLKKPWFLSKTAPDGSWGQGHKDADVNFWIECKRQGLKAAIADVFIGHLQLVCSWCGPSKTQYATTYQHMNETLDGGLPSWTVPKSFHEAQHRRTLMSEEQPKLGNMEVPTPEPAPPCAETAFGVPAPADGQPLTPAGSAAVPAAEVIAKSTADVVREKIGFHETELARINQVLKGMQDQADEHGKSIDAANAKIMAIPGVKDLSSLINRHSKAVEAIKAKAASAVQVQAQHAGAISALKEVVA